MMTHRHYLYVHLLAIASALPSPTLYVVGARDGPDAPKGTAYAVVSVCDHGAVIAGVLGDRTGLDGTAVPIAVRAPVVGARFALSGNENAYHLSHANHPSCAFLCRFLV